MIAPSQTGQTPTITPGQAQQLTSYLYGLKTPEAVQQFAAQHQEDINLVGLASGVANAMKRAQGLAQPQPQGTVAQQAIANMARPTPVMPMTPPPQGAAPAPQAAGQLPENSGIAQLPAQNMQSMAGGGITGEPMRFDGEYGSLVPPVRGGSMPRAPIVIDGAPAVTPYRGYMSSGAPAVPSQQGPFRGYLSNPSAPALAPAPSIQGVPGGSAYPIGVVPGAAIGASSATPTGGAGSTTPTMRPAPTVAASAASSDFDMSPLTNLLKSAGIEQNSPEANMDLIKRIMPVQDVSNHLDAQTNLTEIKNLAKSAGVDVDNSKGFAQLDKLDQKNEDMLDKKTNLAIMAAGFAMMGTPGNPFSAIASGAEKGIGAYAGALDKYQEGAQRLAESRIALEKSKNEMGLGATQTAISMQTNAQKLQFEGNKMQVDAFSSLNNTQGMQRAELARALLNAQNAEKVERMRATSARDVEGMRAASQEKIWGMRGASGIERTQIMAAARSHPDFTKYYNMIQKSSPGANPEQIEAQAATMMQNHGIVGGAAPTGGAKTGVLTYNPKTGNLE